MRCSKIEEGSGRRNEKSSGAIRQTGRFIILVLLSTGVVEKRTVTEGGD